MVYTPPSLTGFVSVPVFPCLTWVPARVQQSPQMAALSVCPSAHLPAHHTAAEGTILPAHTDVPGQGPGPAPPALSAVPARTRSFTHPFIPQPSQVPAPGQGGCRDVRQGLACGAEGAVVGTLAERQSSLSDGRGSESPAQ